MSLNGIIVVDKPEGMTSFRVVSFIRRHLKINKVGHMGTLDPMATGVLPIMLGKATKALDLIECHTKKYIARMKFGVSTDTQDITGKTVKSSNKIVDSCELSSVINEFIGEIYQIPPMYSAIKQNGVKLYELARKGEVVDRKKRKIFIEKINIIDFDEIKQEASIEVTCSRGTYIRSLCSDIGDRLGCGAVMSALRRVESNNFSLDNCIKLEQIPRLIEDNKIIDKIIPIEYVFRNLKKINVTLKQANRFKNGGGLFLERLNVESDWVNDDKYRVFFDDDFVGIGVVDMCKNELSILKLFN